MSIEMSEARWEQLRRWVQGGSEAIYQYIMLCIPVFDELDKARELHSFVARQLTVSCQLTSETAFLLLANGRLWDAEILIRSVTEGTAKYAYMGMAPSAERQRRVNEYWFDLPEADRLKRHERISGFLSLLGEAEVADAQWDPLKQMLLEKAEQERIWSQYPRQMRKEMSHKWSFSEIVSALAAPDCDQKIIFKGLTSLMYGYGMGSHLVHQDGDAIGMIWERNRRSKERRELVQIAHAGRIVSDICTMSMIRAWVTMKFAGQDTRSVRKIWGELRGLETEIHEVTREWWDLESKS